MIKAGIIGSTGYAGAEIVRLLLQHPEAEVVWYGSRSYADQPYADVYRNMFELVDDRCLSEDMDELAKRADVIFTATPQGLCASLVNDEILKHTKIIDLSADFRIKRPDVYEQWYKRTHEAPQFIQEAVYGLCEINRDSIKNARLIANPGCFTTASILTLYPLVEEGLVDLSSIIVDAKSGVSGAGRGAKVQNLYCEVNESVKPYGVTSHRHTPEIEEQLSYAAGMDYENGQSVLINFTPHLVPMNRGILSTCYAALKEGVSASQVEDAYRRRYQDEYFIRLLGEGNFPETRWVEGSNFLDIGWTVDPRTHRLVACGALDNLVKGAAGQAVQNMNILFGLKENTGLELVPLFP